REGGQGQFFYAFDLDKVVPADHLVRQVDSVIDLSWVHKELRYRRVKAVLPMLAAPGIALDLPLKILVSKDAQGNVWLSHGFCCATFGRFWHKAEMPVVSLDVRFREECVAKLGCSWRSSLAVKFLAMPRGGAPFWIAKDQ